MRCANCGEGWSVGHITSVCLRVTRKNAENKQESKGRRRVANRQPRVEDPIKTLKNSWSEAITKADRHSVSCKPCNTKVDGDYISCSVANFLHKDERHTMQSYVDAGGRLPA